MSAQTEDHIAALRADIVALLRQQTGLHEQQAFNMASRVIDVLRLRFSGERIYFGRGQRYDEQAVLRDFTGNNHREVCRKHGISRSTLYNVLHRHQRGLNGSGGP